MDAASAAALLDEWSAAPDGLTSTAAQMGRLYEWLQPRLLERPPLRAQLASSACIWMPIAHVVRDGAPVRGHFRRPEQCVWHGAQLLDCDALRALDGVYSPAVQAAVVGLGVPTELRLANYVDFLRRASEAGPLAPAALKQAFAPHVIAT